MCCELFGSLELAVALECLALVGPFVCVNHHVLIQFPWCPERFWALFALVKLLSCMLLEVGIEPSKVLADFAAFRTLLRTKPLDEIAFFVLNTLFRHWSDRGQLSLLVGFGLMFEKCSEMKLANH
jgi:hypothetical protein